MKELRVHAEATAELHAAMQWYDSKRVGLGLDLHSEVQNAFNRMMQSPQTGARYRNTEFRFILVDRFPYVIYYLELDTVLWIVAISHSRRRPGYWRKRMK